MGLNWKRGFFRIWVVVAAISSVVLCGYVYEQYEQRPHFSGNFALVADSGTFERLPSSGERLELFELREKSGEWVSTRIGVKGAGVITVYLPKQPDEKTLQETLAKPMASLYAKESARFKEQWMENIRNAVFWTFSLLIGLFAFGFSTLWALSGFSKRDE